MNSSAQTTAKNAEAVTETVASLYDTYPFPPDPILDEAPPGYNWRWQWQAAYGFCTNSLMPQKTTPRILDAGCGSGVGTEYLAHLNPHAEIIAVDISAGTLAVAKERCQRSRPNANVQFHQLSLYDIDQIPGQFDLINCVGVLHHIADPIRGIKALAAKLAPGGIFHIFVYAEIGRWEISLMQKAIALLNQSDFKQGVKTGRDLFAALPETNRLVQREKTRWQIENNRDECFADMYVHPHEIDYNIDSLFELIDASGLEFVGFSNPQVWSLERLIGKNPELLKQAQDLPIRQQYRLIELLDTDIAHYEFFLSRPPLPQADWSIDENALRAVPSRHPCIDGWESRCLFDLNYNVCNLTDAEFRFMQLCEGNTNVETILQSLQSRDGVNDEINLNIVRSLLTRNLILMALPT